MSVCSSLFDTEQLARTRSNESKTGRGSLDSKNLKRKKREERKKNEEVRGEVGSGSGNEDLAQGGVGVINARADRVECFNQPPNPRILTSLCWCFPLTPVSRGTGNRVRADQNSSSSALT